MYILCKTHSTPIPPLVPTIKFSNSKVDFRSVFVSSTHGEVTISINVRLMTPPALPPLAVGSLHYLSQTSNADFRIPLSLVIEFICQQK